MKITPRQYATGLYELIENANTSDIDSVLNNFVVFLSNNNDLGLFDKIIVEFSKIFDEKDGVANIDVTSASRLDKKTIDLLSSSYGENFDQPTIEKTLIEIDSDVNSAYNCQNNLTERGELTINFISVALVGACGFIGVRNLYRALVKKN